MYEKKKILIVGGAKSGIAVAKLLAGKENEIILTDLNEFKEKEELENLGIKVVITSNQLNLIDETIDLVIKNPAIMSTNPIIKKCEKLGLRVENEMEVAYHFLPSNVKIIGVTGSNGKTTTTTILYNMLKVSGLDVVMGGNIGIPLCDLLPSIHENSILLLEISDHQLCDFHDFKTDYSILTNICPTHLDYHGTYEHYKMTKKKIFNKHTSKEIAVINLENEDALEASKNILSKKLSFSINKETNCYLKDKIIYLNKEAILNIEDILLQGMHNYENIMAALLVASQFKINIDKIKEFLHTFGGVEHRLEYVTSINDVDYYNDSKSTNPTSTITALKTFKRPIHLILGGLNRNQDYHELDNYMGYVSYLYAIGETTDMVDSYAKDIGIPCFKGYTLDKAMEFLKTNVNEGDIVLLSPASSSQDQYPHFEDRGNEFKDILKYSKKSR